MTQKNETLPLVLTLLITGGILAGGGWWVINKRLPVSTPGNESDRSSSGADTETFAVVNNVPDGLFNYGGSTTWAPIRQQVDKVIGYVWPRFQLRYTNPTTGTPGSGTGIKMLIENQLSFAQSSRPLKDREITKAKDRNISLKEIPVAIDGIAVAVNPDLNIAGLTIGQLKDIYTGKITNWQAVGGPDLPITPYTRRREDGGTIEFFIEQVLDGEDFGKNAQYLYSTTLALREVSKNPGSIYYASAPEVVPQCGVKTIALGKTAGELITPYQKPFVPLSNCPNQRNVLNQQAFKSGAYPITRRLFVIIKQDGGDDERAGNAYAQLLLTAQGQDLITKAGFVALKANN